MPPLIVATIPEVRHAVAKAKRAGKIVGFVPTMGALHQGHASLLRRAKSDHAFVVASIFVNPTQFGPNEDYSRYPRTLQEDVRICDAAGTDVVFLPDANVFYPAGYQTFVEVAELQQGLCGASRPTHFRGVATVVLKFFNIVQPDVAYFGQKDAQQARLLERMVADLDVPVRVEVCPIVREADGLAMSSRNRYLDPDQRRHAAVLHRSLETMRAKVEAGERSAEAIKTLATTMIAATPGAKIDYVEIVGWNDLRPIELLEGEILIAVAVWFGTTRLIDNARIRV
ncbi:MAG: pantoate--beta-alanine ligase [Gemmataceae bacterium]|nr:pantoate--beta-alanine ligase [Gemmataceae bacterium]